MFRIGSAKLVCRLEPEATPRIAYGLFEREGSCFAKMSLQGHSSHTDEDAVATGTCSSKTLASCESGNGTKSCRHVGKKALGRSKVEEFCAEIGETEPDAKTVDKKPKDVKKLKNVKFEVEAMEPNDAKIENEPSDAEVAKIKN